MNMKTFLFVLVLFISIPALASASTFEYLGSDDWNKFTDIQLYDYTNYTEALGFSVGSNVTVTISNGIMIFAPDGPGYFTRFYYNPDMADVPTTDFEYFFITYRDTGGNHNIKFYNGATATAMGYLPKQDGFVTRVIYANRFLKDQIRLYYEGTGEPIEIKNFGFMKAKVRKHPRFTLDKNYIYDGWNFSSNPSWVREAFKPNIDSSHADEIPGGIESYIAESSDKNSYFYFATTNNSKTSPAFEINTWDSKAVSGAYSQAFQVKRNNEIFVIYMKDDNTYSVKLNGDEVAPVNTDLVPKGNRLYILQYLEAGDTVEVQADDYGYIRFTPDPLSYEAPTETYSGLLNILVLIVGITAVLGAIKALKI